MNLIKKISDVITRQKYGQTHSENIYVIDYKNINGGGVEICDIEPDHNSVRLNNQRNVEICYFAFEENALRVPGPEGQVKQCECVLFPIALNDNDWVLFIETKYTESLEIALRQKVDYPNTMIEQIISTVNYFRDNNLLPREKRVYAIVAFPKLLENFSEAFFTRSRNTPEEILEQHKIFVRATNSAVIKSEKTIKL